MTEDRFGVRVTITYYDGNTPHTIDLGTITKMARTIQKKTTVTPIVSLDMQSAFPIDTGNSQSISISFIHKNGQNNKTNVVWYSELTSFIDRWQARTNGCILKCTSAEDPTAENYYVSDAFSGMLESGVTDPEGVGGYIKSITREYTADFNEVIKGTLDFVVGTMHVNDETVPITPNPVEDVNGTNILISDSTRTNWYAIQYGQPGANNDNDKYNCVESLTITGGMESPFETATITIPKKKLMEQIPALYGDIIDSKNGLIINNMGHHTMYVDRVKKSGQKIVIRAITYAQLYQQNALSTPITNTPWGHIYSILTDSKYGTSYSDDNIIQDFNSTLDKGEITFLKGTKIWRILQICATLLRARIFFADNNAYILDYTVCLGNKSGSEAIGPGRYKRSNRTMWVGMVELQNADVFKNRLVDVKEIDEEGKAPAKNKLTAICTDVTSEEDSTLIQHSIEVTDDGSITEYGEEDKGTVQLTELTIAQAQTFGANHLLYVREPQRSITFTLKEVYGASGHSDKRWGSFFGPSAQVGTIVDSDSEDVVSNASSLYSPPFAYQKLCLSSYTRRFPEGTCEYTFGTVANVDLSNDISQTNNTLNAMR